MKDAPLADLARTNGEPTTKEFLARPIAGTPDGGEIQWSREYDVQTYGVLIQVGLKGETPRWRQIPFRENEPRWWDPMQRLPPRESPQTMRPGIVEKSESGEYWEYLGQFQQGHISVRQWSENNTRTGTFLSPCPLSNTYWGAAGTIRLSGLNRLRFQRVQRVLYRYITPNKLEVLGRRYPTVY
jgi:hypothetical protein